MFSLVDVTIEFGGAGFISVIYVAVFYYFKAYKCCSNYSKCILQVHASALQHAKQRRLQSAPDNTLSTGCDQLHRSTCHFCRMSGRFLLSDLIDSATSYLASFLKKKLKL